MDPSIGDVVTVTHPNVEGVPLLKQLLEHPSFLNRFRVEPSFPGDHIAGLVSAFDVSPADGSPWIMVMFLGAGALWMSAHDLKPLRMKGGRRKR
jgi:hypothetical protein